LLLQLWQSSVALSLIVDVAIVCFLCRGHRSLWPTSVAAASLVVVAAVALLLVVTAVASLVVVAAVTSLDMVIKKIYKII